jgi:hypothetical protein
LAISKSLLATACSHQDTQLDVIARELETTVNRCDELTRVDEEEPEEIEKRRRQMRKDD